MRISDWSSDVCSSDLSFIRIARLSRVTPALLTRMSSLPPSASTARGTSPSTSAGSDRLHGRTPASPPISAATAFRASDRKSVVEGTSVSVSVDLGGRRMIQKKTQKKYDQNYKRKHK